MIEKYKKPQQHLVLIRLFDGESFLDNITKGQKLKAYWGNFSPFELRRCTLDDC
jgi:hypothetical protein